MKRKNIVIIILIIYLFSVFGSVKNTQHTYKHEWETLNPDVLDTIFCFVPIINTFEAITFLFYYFGIYKLAET